MLMSFYFDLLVDTTGDRGERPKVPDSGHRQAEIPGSQ